MGYSFGESTAPTPDYAGTAAPDVGASIENPPAVGVTRLSNGKLLIFSLLYFPLSVFVIPVAYYLPAFMTGEMGLSLSSWALVILLARGWDMIVDPVVGVFCDRMPSRWGRRRHWIVIGAPLVAAGVVLVAMPRLFIDHATFAYALGALCVMHVGTTIFGLNVQAWGAELSDDYHERSRIIGWRSILSAIAPLVGFGVGIAVERLVPGAPNGEKLYYSAIVVLTLLPVFLIAALLTIPEAPSRVRVKTRESRLSLLKSWALLLQNKNMIRLIVIEIASSVPMSVTAAVSVFYIKFVLEAPTLQSTLMLGAFFFGFASMPLWLRAGRHLEKHRLLAYTQLAAALITVPLVFIGPGSIWFFVVITCLMGAFVVGPMFLLRSMVADVVDSDTLATGEERTGTFYALTDMTGKLAPTLAVVLVFPFLEWMGFDPSGKNITEQGLQAVKYAYALFPPIPLLISAYLLYNFPLGKAEQEELRRKIREAHG